MLNHKPDGVGDIQTSNRCLFYDLDDYLKKYTVDLTVDIKASVVDSVIAIWTKSDL